MDPHGEEDGLAAPNFANYDSMIRWKEKDYAIKRTVAHCNMCGYPWL